MTEGPPVQNPAPRAETWQPRVEIPIQKDYFAFQVAFAQEVAQSAGISLFDAVLNYAPMIRGNAFVFDEERLDYQKLPGVTESTMLDVAYKQYLYGLSQEPIPYRAEKRFGCSSYDYNAHGGIVRLHFTNHEHDAAGPLRKERLGFRRQEVADLVRAVHERYPDARTVQGHSWLYNLEAYRRIYPASYTQNLVLDESRRSWSRGPLVWGQFLDSNRGLHTERAALLMERLKTLPRDATMSELLRPPLMLPIKVEAPIGDFYREYGVDASQGTLDNTV